MTQPDENEKTVVDNLEGASTPNGNPVVAAAPPIGTVGVLGPGMAAAGPAVGFTPLLAAPVTVNPDVAEVVGNEPDPPEDPTFVAVNDNTEPSKDRPMGGLEA